MRRDPVVPLRARVADALRREDEAQPIVIAHALGVAPNRVTALLRKGVAEGWVRIVRNAGGRAGVVYALAHGAMS